MKRNSFFKVMMLMVMLMTSANAFGGDHRPRNNNSRRVVRTEYRDNRYSHKARPVVKHPTRVVHRPKLDRHGYLPGWEGRVRFVNNRWGYMRNNRWMWYDTYFDPHYYYAHPLSHFSVHFSGEGATAVAAGVATAVVVGSLVSALCH